LERERGGLRLSVGTTEKFCNYLKMFERVAKCFGNWKGEGNESEGRFEAKKRWGGCKVKLV
jgi:hypothetical protein